MNRFKELRIRNNYHSVAQTSKKLQISASYLWSIENDTRFPSIRVLKRFANLYNCRIDDFV